MKYLIGVDGGGTKTSFLLINETGAVLDECTLGCTNYDICGIQVAVETLEQGIKELLQKNDLTAKDIGYVCMGLSGMDFPHNIATLEKHFPSLFGDFPYYILNDLWIAFQAAGDVSYGAVSVSGTGHNVGVITKNGTKYGINALRYPLGNWGGGRMLTDEVFHAAFQSYEHTGKKSLLEERLPAFCGTASMEELLHKVQDSGYQYQYQWEVPKLADEIAAEKDQVTIDMLLNFGYQQGKMAAGLLEHAGMHEETPLVVLAGSIYTKFQSSYILDGYKKALKEKTSDFKIKLLHREPVFGAALFALCLYHGQNEANLRLEWMNKLDQSYKRLAKDDKC